MENNINEQKSTNKKSKEIDVVGIVLTILKEPKELLKFVGVASVLGILIAFTTPKTYTASVIMAPEFSGGSSLSNLSDIASSFGVNLGSNTGGVDAIYPDIYPDVLSSPDFLMPLFDVKVRLKDSNEEKTYREHIQQDSKVALYNYHQVLILKIKQALKKGKENKGEADPYIRSLQESKMCEGLANSIVCLVDKKTSIISISISDQDPLVAAIMVDTIQRRLQEYIIEYRTNKCKNDYNYYKKLYDKSLEEYKKAQKIYSDYCDTHHEILLESYITKRNTLEDEMQTAYNAMNQFRTSVMTSEAQIQEATPSYTIITKPTMPHKPSSTPRIIVVAIFAFFGIVCDFVWVSFLRKMWNNRKNK